MTFIQPEYQRAALKMASFLSYEAETPFLEQYMHAPSRREYLLTLQLLNYCAENGLRCPAVELCAYGDIELSWRSKTGHWTAIGYENERLKTNLVEFEANRFTVPHEQRFEAARLAAMDC